MSWIRKTWVIRSMALLLIGSLVPMLLAPMVQARHYASSHSYVGWVQNQLGPIGGDEIDVALEKALETRPASFDDFLAAFVDAYVMVLPKHQSTSQKTPLNDTLFIYLKSRFLRLVGSAVLPGTLFKVTQTRTPVTSFRINGVKQSLVFEFIPLQTEILAITTSTSVLPQPHPHLLSASRPGAP